MADFGPKEARILNAQSRRRRVLRLIQESGNGISSIELASMIGVDRAIIISDVVTLRKRGWPIQTSTYKPDEGPYAAYFSWPSEMPIAGS